MRSAKSLNIEFYKAAKASEQLCAKPRKVLDTSRAIQQAKLLGVMHALGWALGAMKNSPVETCIQETTKK